MKFNQDNIFLNVDVKDKVTLFNFISKKANIMGVTNDPNELVKSFIHREEEMSTGLQESFAIPHAKAECILKPIVLFIKLRVPIEWETFDDKPVQNVFALMVPKKFEGTVHLEMISRIATSLLEDEFIDIVKGSNNLEDLEKEISKAMEGAY